VEDRRFAEEGDLVISLGYIRVTLSVALFLLPNSYLDVLRPRACGVSCTFVPLRCCLCR